jgi:hypothetical protein
MLVNFKIFHEITDADFENYNKLWDQNKERFIFLPTNLPLSEQIDYINIFMDSSKDILAVRFVKINELQLNKIMNDIFRGNGFLCKNNKIWYPKEVWIYCP